jgi:hypothetical protein
VSILTALYYQDMGGKGRKREHGAGKKRKKEEGDSDDEDGFMSTPGSQHESLKKKKRKSAKERDTARYVYSYSLDQGRRMGVSRRPYFLAKHIPFEPLNLLTFPPTFTHPNKTDKSGKTSKNPSTKTRCQSQTLANWASLPSLRIRGKESLARPLQANT